jgi:superfamily I DNA and/or RNA helicase
MKEADKANRNLHCCQKVATAEDSVHRLSFVTDNDAMVDALASSHVGGATAWFWARPDIRDIVDVLVVDEAAQMSLANVLAISQAAKAVILLGDPQQLDQPMQGTHPEGCDISALDYLLNGEVTLSAERGLFLDDTWRLHPDICAFTSELFYEGRLNPRAELANQWIRSSSVVQGAGLRYVPVLHENNQSWSMQEARAVELLVKQILAASSTWIDANGNERPVTLHDILVIAPYNAQVFEIQRLLPGARVGTVDKFQGQEAPIAIYSTATSSHADAPRGMEFLYSLNRLNVATSRARCLSIIVASPQLLTAECRTPRQMHLVNAFCRFVELAAPIQL